MKIKELIYEVIEERKNNSDESFDLSTLYGKKDLENIKDRILECDEFSECESIEIVDFTTIDIEGHSYSAMSYKLGEEKKFKGKFHLLSLMLTPEIYDPNDMLKEVKDGCSITPVLYNSKTFEPFRRIVIKFSPENLQDGLKNQENVVKKEIHSLLDKILDNPEDYKIKGERNVLIRGFSL